MTFLKKGTTIVLLLVLIVAFFVGCEGEKGYRTDKTLLNDIKLYDNVGSYVKTEIKEKYQTKGIVNDDPELPKTYTWTLKTEEDFDLFIEDAPFQRDFEKCYYVLYTFTCYELRSYLLSDINVADDWTILKYSLEKLAGEPAGTATAPFQRWFVVELKKPVAKNVFLIENTSIRIKASSDRFYTLQEAYDGGMLTVEDLQVIAEYHEKGVSVPEPLDPNIENAIKEVAAREMHEKENIEDATADGFWIYRYYGTYNECVAFMIRGYILYPAVVLDENEIVAGVRFHYTDPNRIIVWAIKYNV